MIKQTIKPEEIERLREELLQMRRNAISLVRQVETLLELPDNQRMTNPKIERVTPPKIDKPPDRV